jgi:hypothetical protein
VYCRRRRGVHGRSAAGDRHVPALLREPRPRRRAAVRPAPGRNPGRPADTAQGCPVTRTPLGSGPGRRSRQTPTVRRSDSGRGLRKPATRRRPARWTPATAAWARGHCGNGRLDSRQRNRPLPLGCPAGNGTARCGIGQHRHGQTARSVVWGRPESQHRPGKAAQLRKPVVKVSAGSTRQNVDRVVDRAEQAHSVRAPDFDLVLFVDPRSSANILDHRMAHAGSCAGSGPLPTTGRNPRMTRSTP